MLIRHKQVLYLLVFTPIRIVLYSTYEIHLGQTQKRNQHKKHSPDFADAYKVFESPALVGADKREDYGEDRWLGIGSMDNPFYLPFNARRKKRFFTHIPCASKAIP